MVRFSMLLCLSLLSLRSQAQEYKVFVEADKNAVTLGGIIQLTYRFKGGVPLAFQSPDLGKNFKQVGYISQGNEIRTINGRRSQMHTFSFAIRAVKIGKSTITPAVIKSKAGEFASDPITLKVLDKSQLEKEKSARIAKNIYIKAYLSESDVYVGQQINLRYKLFIKSNMPVSELSVKSQPEYDGFWKETISDHVGIKLQEEVVDNQRYQTGVLESVILLPQKTGDLVIDPYILHTKIREQAQSNGRNIFDDFFGNYKYYNHDVKSQQITIKVKSLPKNKPTNYSGLVGTFDFSAELNKTQAEKDDGVTLNVIVKGQGNLKLLKPWELSLPPGIEDYPCKVHDNISFASGSLGGTRHFEYLLYPRREGVFKLPKIDFSYFDVEKESFVQFESGDLQFKVGNGQNQQVYQEGQNPDAVQHSVDYINEDIEFIQVNNISLREKGQSSFGSAMHIVGVVSPLALLSLLIVARRKKEEAAKDVVGTKKKKATNQAKKRLKKAAVLLESKKEEEFYNEISKAIYGFLGDKLSIEEGQMSHDVISEKLIAHGGPQELADETKSFLAACEFARFAPGNKEDKMNEIYSQAMSLISQLENILLH